MKTKKLLGKLKSILSADRQAQLEKYASLKKVLKALRVQKHELSEQLSNAEDEDARKELASRLKVVSKQRKKGLIVLQELKDEREKKSRAD